jgi:hypothetical protein
MEAAKGLLWAVYIPISNDRNVQSCFYGGYCVPIGRPAEALLSSATVKREHPGSRLLQFSAPIHGSHIPFCVLTLTTPTETGFDRDRKSNRSNHGFNNPAGEIWVANESAAASFPGDFANWTSHIDVNQESTVVGSATCGIGHRGWMVIKELHTNRPSFLLQTIHLEASVPQLKACGIDHFCEQQCVWSPAAHQLPEDSITDSSERGLQCTTPEFPL